MTATRPSLSRLTAGIFTAWDASGARWIVVGGRGHWVAAQNVVGAPQHHFPTRDDAAAFIAAQGAESARD